jgi:hypothetical protein
MHDNQSEKKRELETEGGFNPDRPKRPSIEQVGPLPTDDPKGKATPSLEKELKDKADRSRQ